MPTVVPVVSSGKHSMSVPAWGSASSGASPALRSHTTDHDKWMTKIHQLRYQNNVFSFLWRSPNGHMFRLLAYIRGILMKTRDHDSKRTIQLQQQPSDCKYLRDLSLREMFHLLVATSIRLNFKGKFIQCFFSWLFLFQVAENSTAGWKLQHLLSCGGSADFFACEPINTVKCPPLLRGTKTKWKYGIH